MGFLCSPICFDWAETLDYDVFVSFYAVTVKRHIKGTEVIDLLASIGSPGSSQKPLQQTREKILVKPLIADTKLRN